jgi:trimethylamine--corrinoid protein Co-methyltransferase
MTTATPGLTLLSVEQIEQVHAWSLKILAEVGLRIDSAEARRIFSQTGAATLLDEDRVLIRPELVEWAIRSAPHTIQIFDRTAVPRFNLGADRARFGIGVTNLYYQDPSSGENEFFNRRHLQASVRLGHVLPGYDVISTPGILRDIGPRQADLYASLDMLASTTKPLVLLVSDETQFAPLLDLFTILHGDLAQRPFIIPYFNPVTPLVMNEDTTRKMQTAVGRGIPFIYSNYGMVGMSTPVTPAGTLALLHAELLAGLVFSQVLKAGTPVVLGMLPAYFEMKTMVDFYDPRTMLLNLACAEMLAHYRLPHAGTSGSGNGWGADLIASGSLWMNHLTACIGRVGLAPFVGGSLGSKVFSPAMAVYAHEVIEQARAFAAGFEIDADSSALDDIFSEGPGGHFLTTPRTLRLFRSAYHTGKIFPHWGLEKWEESGKPQADALLREHTLQLLADAQPPPDSLDLLERGEQFIRNLQI